MLHEHRARQAADKKKAGAGWANTGRVFTQEDGSWLRPSHVTDRLTELGEEITLPPGPVRSGCTACATPQPR
ncbi:hypothetical protein [Streptomyces sp. NPDC056730]|uniref:hypothetical protein n=1 Tax=Streptomyces sp. NPDC056730 TaxID=3345929 RepID=UPI003679CDC1